MGNTSAVIPAVCEWKLKVNKNSSMNVNIWLATGIGWMESPDNKFLSQ